LIITLLLLLTPWYSWNTA